MKTKNQKIKIITFREFILPKTETFIETQTSSLQQHSNHYVGLRRLRESLNPINSPILTINTGNLAGHLKELFFKKTGFIPRSALNKLKRIKFRLCHSHFGPDSIYALKISKALNIPLVVTFHGYDATTLKNPRKAKTHKQKLYFNKKNSLIEQASLFIAVSNYIRSELLEQGFPDEKIRVHYIGIDTSIYQFNSAIKRDNIVLFVGRLVEKKGCKYLIEAMQLLNNKDIKLVIIGDGPLRFELEKQASKASINYQFLGHQPSQEVKKWMMKSKLLCVPSITACNGDSEGFGMVFAEAQAIGTPVVSTNSGGIPESVKHMKTGLLAEEGDSKKLAEYIGTLLTENKLWEEYSKAGIKRVNEKFCLQKQTKKLENMYKLIINK